MIFQEKYNSRQNVFYLELRQRLNMRKIAQILISPGVELSDVRTSTTLSVELHEGHSQTHETSE